jgi:hypothetical protein
MIILILNIQTNKKLLNAIDSAASVNVKFIYNPQKLDVQHIDNK